MLSVVLVLLITLFANVCNSHKLVIDNDAGGDDAMSIFIALLYEKHFDGPELIALTTGNGNADEDKVFVNNQKILTVAKRREVPIYRGSKESLIITPTTTAYYGEDGLGNNNQTLSEPIPAQQEDAVQILIDLAKKISNDLTLVTVGTLTNVALAIKLDPEFLQRINHLYIGGSHINSDKYPNAEFNVHMDPEAFQVVMNHANPDKVTVVPFSQVIEHLSIDKDWRINVLGGLNTDIMRAQNEYERVALAKKSVFDSLDPATVSLALSNIPKGSKKVDFVTEYKYSRSDMILCGENRGKTTNNFVEKEKANVRIAYSFDMEKYMSFLMDVMSAEVAEK